VAAQTRLSPNAITLYRGALVVLAAASSSRAHDLAAWAMVVAPAALTGPR